jgi:hypothetical protein
MSNVQLNKPTTQGAIIATDDIENVKHQLIKIEYGEEGTATPVSLTNPLPIKVDGLALSSNQVQPFGYDAGGRTRVSQLTTLLDGKILGADDTDLFENVGTGTFTFQNNTMLMSVTAGQYCIRQSKRFSPYFSGKSQLVEETFDSFQLEPGIIKRVGYFSSNAVAPYNSTKDGFWLESNGDDNKFYIRSSKSGVLTVNDDVSNYFLTYNAENFTVTAFDFLWLGGAVLRTFIKNTTGFDTISSMDFAGKQKGTFITSPNQPIRYELRSTTGVGSFRYICSQVATEGSFTESGKTLTVYNSTSISSNTIGTVYALTGLKKQITFRDIAIQILSISAIPSTKDDAGILMLFVNPTLSAPLVYTNKSKIQQAVATNQTVNPNTGRLIVAVPIGQPGNSTDLVKENFLAFLQSKIDNSLDEYVLAYMPISINQNINGVLMIKEY